MALPSNILVPVDFETPSLRACDRACELARDSRAQVTLVHALEERADEALAARRMGALTKKLRDAEVHVARGAPVDVVLAAIATRPADLVVCGTNNRRGLAYLALGSVAEGLVRRCPVPVLTVPGFAFDSREVATRRLIEALPALPPARKPAATSVVALGTRSLVIARAVADHLGAPLDLWAHAPITLRGRTVGALGEDELAYFDDPSCAPSLDRADAEAEARSALREELAYVRGARAIGDVDDRVVVLVADMLTSPAIVRSATNALRDIGAAGFVLATPVARASALVEVAPLVDASVSLEQTVAADPRKSAYRRDVQPSYREVRHLLYARRTHLAMPIPTRFAS